MSRPCVGLVLGSGSARGNAHVGVLQVFQEAEVPVDLVVGCSAGAICAALYAVGADLYMVEKLLGTYPLRKQLMDLKLPKQGFVKGDKILEFLRLLTKDMSFEEARVKLAVVATNIENGQQVVFTQGKIAPAVRASISIPGLFWPFYHQEMMLVDGAVIERLPLGVAKNLGAEYIIGVDVKGCKEVKVRNVMDVIMQSIEIMEEEIFRRMEIDADVLIQPEVGHIGSFKFEACDEAISLGRKAALKHLPKILKDLNLPLKHKINLEVTNEGTGN